ncbi:hypothetical protein [Mycoplasmopsis gallinarum]|uniref:Uncharacterized protein n=1 Tax=Mycoplasmopsis gallinarum TaxID=29557 RepID=A0A168RPL9_9BACT|nr:hypothetical protein [Mycoplasmopsis gallinarum]OAB49171.1 hypothetical protein MGALLINA_00390 [Mycoplasmopsis gallinarum]
MNEMNKKIFNSKIRKLKIAKFLDIFSFLIACLILIYWFTIKNLIDYDLFPRQELIDRKIMFEPLIVVFVLFLILQIVKSILNLCTINALTAKEKFKLLIKQLILPVIFQVKVLNQYRLESKKDLEFWNNKLKANVFLILNILILGIAIILLDSYIYKAYLYSAWKAIGWIRVILWLLPVFIISFCLLIDSWFKLKIIKNEFKSNAKWFNLFWPFQIKN